MFSAVVLTTSSIRTLNIFTLKKEKYEISYATVLSLKAMLENREFNPMGGKFTGKINGFDYDITYKILESRRTYVTGETIRTTGNLGPYNIYLYSCVLNLLKEGSYSESSFEILKYQEVVSSE